MPNQMNRRTFIKESLLASAAGAIALQGKAQAQDPGVKPTPASNPAPANDPLPTGRIGKLQISRLLLGGNLLTHFTHSRDLMYVYKLAEHYNTEEKILQTLALAEQHGINTMSVHNPPGILKLLKEHRKRGGKMQWIICPTAPVEGDMSAYIRQVQELVVDGTDAIYLWGVRSDPLAGDGKIDLIAKAVQIAKDHGVPSGVGAHDLKVVVECEKNKVGADFYIKTFHHHKYPSAPKPDELKAPYNEVPGYWCKDPKATIDVMKDVEKPWIAFKVMAAGAIPPKDAFQYAFQNGADHVLAGMFDFEIAADVALARKIIPAIQRSRPWRS
jgi:hypothetical protein